MDFFTAIYCSTSVCVSLAPFLMAMTASDAFMEEVRTFSPNDQYILLSLIESYKGKWEEKGAITAGKTYLSARAFCRLMVFLDLANEDEVNAMNDKVVAMVEDNNLFPPRVYPEHDWVIIRLIGSDGHLLKEFLHKDFDKERNLKAFKVQFWRGWASPQRVA